MKDLSAYTGTLPYASELFGIYQPLLGWKSQIVTRRINRSVQMAHARIAETVLNRVRLPITVQAVRATCAGGRHCSRGAPPPITTRASAMHANQPTVGFSPATTVGFSPPLTLATIAQASSLGVGHRARL
jgi:hypothetical protein